MEKVNKTASCFTVDKYMLSKLNNDEAFKEYVIEELSNNLARHLADILSSEGEVVVKMSDVRCEDNNDFVTVDYRQYLKWSHLVRCKDCKHRPTGTGANHDLEFPDYICPCQCEDFWYSWLPNDDWFCANGERREDDAEIH